MSGTWRQIWKPSGVEYDAPFAILARVQEGRIVHLKDYVNSTAVHRASLQPRRFVELASEEVASAQCVTAIQLLHRQVALFTCAVGR